MESSSNTSSPSVEWTRPDQVMKIQKLKARKNALHARMRSSPLQILDTTKNTKLNASPKGGVKRKNPFKCSPNKFAKTDETSSLNEPSTDSTLFQLLNPSQTTKISTVKPVYSFANILKNNLEELQEPKNTKIWANNLVFDWSLKTRLRFLSSTPLPWKHTFKTSEEASGTTAYVRCISSSHDEESDCCHLDTSNNARFYKQCLTWQHPNIPWLQTFPRDTLKHSSQTGIFGSERSLAQTLKAEWSESLRSLHQLLRVRQCPYFYVCAPTFTCLFRAAGVASISQAHALITPSTRGFRDAMASEGITFKMPFLDKKLSKKGKENDNSDGEDQEDLESEEASNFLETLGVETSQFPHLNLSRTRVENNKYKTVDSSPLSLVYIEDMDLMGLINFLLNSTSCIASTGPLAGVPPTLISPVAFTGGTLKQLKVKGGLIKTEDGTAKHSMELTGPILPQLVIELSNLLRVSSNSFSITLNPVISTIPFTNFSMQDDKTAPQAFAKEGLVDCGLDPNVRSQICCPPNSEIDIRDKKELPNMYKDIEFNDDLFTWN